MRPRRAGSTIPRATPIRLRIYLLRVRLIRFSSSSSTIWPMVTRAILTPRRRSSKCMAEMLPLHLRCSRRRRCRAGSGAVVAELCGVSSHASESSSDSRGTSGRNAIGDTAGCAGAGGNADGLSRLLHYVATRLVPIYIELGEQLSDSEIIGGDDTSTRVLEVNTYFEKAKKAGAATEKNKPPWAAYRTRENAIESIKRCEARKNERLQKKANGDRDAKRPPDEDPTLGMLIGGHFGFESPGQDGKGAKKSLNTTVLSGRTVAKDPRSLIIFYRSHLGAAEIYWSPFCKIATPAPEISSYRRI